MSLLPIVERELRAAARRRSTYRVRSWTALLASLVGFVFLTFIWLTSGGSRAGELLLGVLTAFAAGLSLLTGVFLTSDCISQEKREGTLGLLFLTPLKGYDVVLGKFMAMSVNALYGLLALLPILSLSLLLGGVTGEEFFRTALALVNTLFFSLTAGIWISTLARDSRTAMFGTFGLVLLVFAGLPALHRLLPVAAQSWSWLGSVSPFYPFSYAGEASYYSHGAKYWGTLLASHLLGWAFLGSASWLLPRLWQEKSAADFGSGAGRWRTRAGANATTRAKRRAELLPLSPVLWLVGGEPLLRWVIWAIIACWACVVLAGVSLHSTDPAWIIYGAKPCGFVLKMLVASQACRFFAESRRTGALELLLCTPLRNSEILKGQWLALQRLFLWPVIAFLALALVPSAFRVYLAMMRSQMSDFAGAILAAAGSSLVVLWLAIGLIADFFAVAWTGMWLALTLKKPNLAPALTILLVLILPSIGFCGMDLGVDLVFILWAATKLQGDLRRTVARQYQYSAAPLTLANAGARPQPPPIIV